MTRADENRKGIHGSGPQTHQLWKDRGKPLTKCNKCGDESNSPPNLMCGRLDCEECDGAGGFTKLPASLPEGAEGIWVECEECSPCQGIYEVPPSACPCLAEEDYQVIPGTHHWENCPRKEQR